MHTPNELFRRRPHDTYFEQVFKVLPVALELVRKFLPPDQAAALNLDTLQLSSESFLSEELQEFFSDLVYTCETTDADPIRICLLLEHKSGSAGRRIYVQLGNYLRGVQDEDIGQQRSRFTLTIPILFYHGDVPWDPGPLREQYGPIPPVLAGYIPHFDFVKVNVQAMPDAEIHGMQDAVLLRNIFLAFKHAQEAEYIRRYSREVLIFVRENVPDDVLWGLFRATLLYLQIVSPFNKHDIMEIVETLPLEYAQKAKSAYDEILEEGIEKGIEKGIENLLIAFLKKNPDWSDQQVAECFDIPVSRVRKVRLALQANA